MRLRSAISANLILIADTFFAGIFLFTMLPFTLALLSLPLNALMFARWKTQLRTSQYLLLIHATVFILFWIVYILVHFFGRKYFEYLF